MKKAICKYCGDEFEQSNKGRKKDYCNKEDCIRQARNEANRKWYAKKIEALKGTKNRIIEQKEEPKVIYSSREKANTRIQMSDIGDIVQIARDYGSVRYKMIELLKKNNEDISKFDKEDQRFLHKLEFLEELTDDEAKEMIINEKKSRELRRNVKNRKYLIEAMLGSIAMKNPNAFIVKAIQSDGDICKTIAKLKKDENLYAKKEGSN